jgi:Pyridine nucleotide-disulphide oxidoreductase/Transglutaminase-like superfamily
LRRTAFFEGNVIEIDLRGRRVRVDHGFDGHTHDLEFDQIVLALGSRTQYFDLPGVEENALTMKSLADAIKLRNRLIAILEEADSECSIADRRRLLTVVVAGAGFAGVETLASINDFLRKSIEFYPNLSSEYLQLVLVHPGETLLPELSSKLGKYAQQKLEGRGIQILPRSRVSSYRDEIVTLADGREIPATTLIWTAGTMPHPLINTLPCIKERGRLKVTAELELRVDPAVLQDAYLDSFGNRCSRFHVPAGEVRLEGCTSIKDSGCPDPQTPEALEVPVNELPVDALRYLISSRYCEVDRLSAIARDLFDDVTPGWTRVQAICDWVHEKIIFGYSHARSTKTALDIYTERLGVCRDYQHLAITFCRALNIPARYATGYLGDIGVPAAPYPMDFSAWFEAYLVDVRCPSQSAAYWPRVDGSGARRR